MHLCPAYVSLVLTSISIVPREIFVAICSAWKNDVFSGPKPVLTGEMCTSIGAMAPALAGASTYRLETLVVYNSTQI